MPVSSIPLLFLLVTAAQMTYAQVDGLTPYPGVATSHLNISVTPSFLASGIVTFDMVVQKTFNSDLVRFVFHGPSIAPSYPAWTSIFNSNGWDADKCEHVATLPAEGVFASGGLPAATNGSFDLDTFCTPGSDCPGSLVQNCGFIVTAGLLDPANLRYAGKIEVWLNNTNHELLVGFYDIAIELPLNAQAVAGNSLPITVTLNTNLVTVNTTVTGLGLLSSYLMLCPDQDVPQTVNGVSVGNLTNAVGVTDVYVGETYCMQHVIPSLPSPVILTGHTLYENSTQVLTVAAFSGAGISGIGLYNNVTQGTPVRRELAGLRPAPDDAARDCPRSVPAAPAARAAGFKPRRRLALTPRSSSAPSSSSTTRSRTAG